MRKYFYIILFFILFQTGYGQSITWQKVYPGPTSGQDDYGFDICSDGQGNFYVVGEVFAPVDAFAGYVMKINAYGNIIWTKTINDEQSYGMSVEKVIATSDGGCVITGARDSAYTIKLDSSGNIVWNKTYYMPGNSFAEKLDFIRTLDGGYLGCGRISIQRAYVFKTDSLGNLQWQKVYSAPFFKQFYSVVEYNDKFVLSGIHINSSTSKVQGSISELTDKGVLNNEKLFLLNNEDLYPKKIYQSNNLFYLFGSSIESISRKLNIVFLKLDNTFNILDTVFVNSQNSKSENDELYDADVIDNNKYVVTSFRYSGFSNDTNYAEVKIIDSFGNILNQNKFGNASYTYIYSLIQAPNGDFLGAGFKELFTNNDADIFVIRMDSNLISPVNIYNVSTEIPNNFNLYQNYPNPFNPTTKINYELKITNYVQLKVFNANGKAVNILVNKKQNAGKYEIDFDGTGLASGVYFYALFINGVLLSSKKMVLMK